MKPATLKDRRHAFEKTDRDGKTARFTVIGRATAADATPQREPTPIGRPSVAPGQAAAAPPMVAAAELRVKRFHGTAAEDVCYTATLHASSAAPAALLAALADAAAQIEDLARAGSPGEHVILSVAIRR
jgi:hypothetical protein